MVRNDHDPPVYPDDRLSHAFCAFCAHDETCDDGACSDGTSETLCRGFWDGPIYHWHGTWWWEYGAGETHLHTDNAQLSGYRNVNACGLSGKRCPRGEGGHTALCLSCRCRAACSCRARRSICHSHGRSSPRSPLLPQRNYQAGSPSSSHIADPCYQSSGNPPPRFCHSDQSKCFRGSYC